MAANRLSLLLVVALLSSSFVQGAVKPLRVEIEPDNQVAVKIGQSQTILCKVGGVPLKVCRFQIPGEGSLILSENQSTEDGIAYFGEGLNHGYCGVKIMSIKEIHDGNVTCYVTPNQGRSESYNTVSMIVARPPTSPELHVSQGGKYMKGAKMEVSCIARDGKPPANVTLFLDDQPLQHVESPITYGRPSAVDDHAILNTSRAVTVDDHGKQLRCEVNHIALAQPLTVSRTIDVEFPPQEQSGTIQSFGHSIGRRGMINVTVHANPKPQFTWIVGGENIPDSRTDSSGRLQASSPVLQGHGRWVVILTIDSVQKTDIDKEYQLRAENPLGYSTYTIVLSSSSEPPSELDAGSIIGIVIGVLALILAVFLIVFARATGRWCFAGGSDKRTIGEADLAEPAESVNLLRFVKPKTDDATPRRSDTESTGHYSRTEVDTGKSGRPKISFSQLFKRNKDKVSGADTDTVRTIVTMDDEKIPVSETTTAAETPTNDGSLVYAELDHARNQQPNSPRRLTEDKTEYAEILYTKPDELPKPDK